jgi:hypothetical protein
VSRQSKTGWSGREPRSRRRSPQVAQPPAADPAVSDACSMTQGETTMGVDEQSTGGDSGPIAASSSDEVISRIELEANALSPQEQQHLHSHLVSNAVLQLNEETYLSTQVFKELLITFQNLRANSKSFLNIRHDQRAIFAEGDASHRLVGLSLSTSADPVIYVRSFLVNAREMYLQTYRDCTEITVRLYVRTEQSYVKGRVDLAPGAAVTLESRNDRSTLIGLSSFAVDLA